MKNFKEFSNKKNMRNFNFKKSIFAMVCLLVIFAGIGAVYSVAREGEGIAKFLNGSTPSITSAFLDKEKYFPGDIMKITVETEDASKVKAFVENEMGFNEVSLVAMAVLEGKETWTGNWKVENSLTDKKYKLKIVASNKSGSVETMLEWEDPNPGHPWNQIDNFPGACPAGQYINQIGNPPSCSTPTGGSPVSWNCEYVVGPPAIYLGWPYTNTEALCSAGYVLISGGGSTNNCDEYAQGIVGGSSRLGWWVSNRESEGTSVTPFALCCK